MEYTKDVFSSIFFGKVLNLNLYNTSKSILKNFIKENKFIITILSLLSVLITIDIALVNSFLELLSTLY